MVACVGLHMVRTWSARLELVDKEDPLLPLVFGLSIDRIDGRLQEKLPHAVAEMVAKLIQMLLHMMTICCC